MIDREHARFLLALLRQQTEQAKALLVTVAKLERMIEENPDNGRDVPTGTEQSPDSSG